MKKLYLFVLLLISSLLLSGCFHASQQTNTSTNTQEGKEIQQQLPKVEIKDQKMMDETEKSEELMMQEENKMDETVMQKNLDDEVMMDTEKEEITYSGNILAGTISPFLDFNKSDYDKALAANKNIVLYFYASWCPICREEIKETYAAFNELSDPNTVGFRVNFNDSDTDSDEVALAREFGIAYQHTKVFLKDGQRVLKSPSSWKKQQYLDEIQNNF